MNLDEVVPSKLAETWEDGDNGKDLRPKMTDGNNVTYLLDSGSMCCVWPAPEGAAGGQGRAPRRPPLPEGSGAQ